MRKNPVSAKTGRLYRYEIGGVFRGSTPFFRSLLEYDRKTKSYAVYCPKLPGCASAGDTEEEALANIKEAIALYLEPAPVKPRANGKVVEVEITA